MFSYKCHGTCSTSIDLEIRDGVITYCKINKKMVTGQKADEVAEKLAGIPCRGDTSCPDQLSRAIRAYHD